MHFLYKCLVGDKNVYKLLNSGENLSRERETTCQRTTYDDYKLVTG